MGVTPQGTLTETHVMIISIEYHPFVNLTDINAPQKQQF